MSATTTTIAPFSFSANWLNYFDVRAAVESVMNHVAQLPSSQTDEKHTARVYADGLKYFLTWYGDRLPNEALVMQYIAHLLGRGLKSSTISSKYLAPLRLFLNKLVNQSIVCTEAERELVQDCKEAIRLALQIKSPKPATVSNIAPLWRGEFKRLGSKEVNMVLRGLPDTLIGKRDYALLHIAFSTGLRLAELARISMGCIVASPDGTTYLVTVRGKRGNVDPVSITHKCYADIVAWVQAYNALVEKEGDGVEDPRYITKDTPLWQGLLHGGHLVKTSTYKPERGISHQALRDVIAKRTGEALGEDNALAAHDTRRTCAAIAYDAGMGIPEIQGLLRHKNPAVTLNYIGQKPDFNSRTLGLRVSFG
jgi:integrase